MMNKGKQITWVIANNWKYLRLILLREVIAIAEIMIRSIIPVTPGTVVNNNSGYDLCSLNVLNVSALLISSRSFSLDNP